MYEKPKRIPILKNGGAIGLQLVKVGSTRLTISNTCAFDSIFQIILAAAKDNSTYEQNII